MGNLTCMPAVHHLPGCGHSTSLPLSFAQDVHIVQMLHFAQLAARKTSLLTLGMHTLHSRLQPLNIFWQPACWGSRYQQVMKSILKVQ